MMDPDDVADLAMFRSAHAERSSPIDYGDDEPMAAYVGGGVGESKSFEAPSGDDEPMASDDGGGDDDDDAKEPAEPKDDGDGDDEPVEEPGDAGNDPGKAGAAAPALQIDARVLPLSLKPEALAALPPAVLAFVKQYYKSFFVLCSDVVTRFARARPANPHAFLTFAQTLRRHIRTFDAQHKDDPDALFAEITRLYTDAAVFAKLDYSQPSGACTAAVIAAVQLRRRSYVPTVNCTRALYDSVRSPRFKAHVFPLARLPELRGWKLTRANFEPAFASADAVQRHPFFARALRDGTDTALRARIAEWVRTRALAAHANFVALARDMAAATEEQPPNGTLRLYRNVGMQLMLRRVNVRHSENHGVGAVFANVCYRVEDVVMPLSANAQRRGSEMGFSGTLYYRFTHSRGRRRSRPSWGAIGGRTFWKHYRALESERRVGDADEFRASAREFAIVTSGDGVTEFEQMHAYVRLLGLAPEDAALGPFYSRVVFGSVPAHNMGVLRALWSFMGGQGYADGDADNDDDADNDGSTTPLSSVLAMQDDGMLALVQPAVRDMPHYRRDVRAEKRRARAGHACPRRGVQDVRGTVDDAGDAWFGDGGAAADGTCRPSSRAISPLWLPAPTWSDEMLPRWLLSEWRRRSRAVVNKPYVSVGAGAAHGDALDAAQHMRSAIDVCPARQEFLDAIALAPRYGDGHAAVEDLGRVFQNWSAAVEE